MSIMKESLKFNIHDLIISGKILASALQLSKKIVQPNITSLEIDSQIEGFIASKGAEPSFKGLDGYAYSTCISINSQVVHGVPNNIKLELNDVVTVDIGVSYNSHCTDAARTFVVGNNPHPKVLSLIQTAYTALNMGISQARIGNRVGDISFAIQKQIYKGNYQTSLIYGGHGIGLRPHMDPFIPNYGRKNTGSNLIPGACLAIEPIVIDGPNDLLESEIDGWTVYSPHDCLSAHVEDTVIVAHTPIILTRETLDGKII